MKSETKKDTEKFVSNHSYVESLVIHNKKNTSFFPEACKKDKGVSYSELFEEINKNIATDSYYFVLNKNSSILYIIVRGGIAFIFECSEGTSVAQIKLEADDFVNGFQGQGKYRKFFSSIFDW